MIRSIWYPNTSSHVITRNIMGKEAEIQPDQNFPASVDFWTKVLRAGPAFPGPNFHSVAKHF